MAIRRWRIAALLSALTLAGCARQKLQSDAARYDEARRLLDTEHLQAASAKTDSGLLRTAPGSTYYWRFRLLKAEILLAQREAKQAEAALHFEPPSGAEWTEYRGRHFLCQAFTAALLNRPMRARALLDQARSFAEAAHSANLLAEIEFRRSWLAVETGRFPEAETGLRHVLEYATHARDPYLQMKANGNMGYLLLRSFRYDEAIPWFEKTIASATALGALESKARNTGNLGWCYYQLGDLNTALSAFEEAEKQFEYTGNRHGRQIWLGNAGSIFLNRKEYRAAAEHYKRALEIATALKDETDATFWLNNLALIGIETNDFDSAQRYNDAALALKHKLNAAHSELYSIVNAARIAYGRKEYQRSEILFRSAIGFPSDNPTSEDPTPLLDAHAGLAALLAETGRLRQADGEFQSTIRLLNCQAAKLLKDEYKLSYFAGLIDFYKKYVDFLMATGRISAALETAESSRARVMEERLGRTDPARGLHTAAEFQKLAAATGSTLLSYWLGPRQSYLWVITGTGVSVVHLPAASEISRLVDAYNQAIQNLRDPLDEERSAGQQLYNILVAPAEPEFSRTRKVILVPDSSLYALNFETLISSGEKPHYWIEDTAVAIAPSLGLLSTGRTPAAPANGSLLLIGNPVPPTAEYPTLDFAGQEIASVARSLPAFQQVVLTSSNAQPGAYERANPSRFTLIHFAAHAKFNREAPLESAVILSREAEKYKLLVRDVMKIPITAQLVTISACRSAGDRIYDGEGLTGFAWAFLQAGARNVIAGLWDVDDRSTASLMEHLYAGLSLGTASSEALRSAKLQLIHTQSVYRKPYYWAPFELFTASSQ